MSETMSHVIGRIFILTLAITMPTICDYFVISVEGDFVGRIQMPGGPNAAVGQLCLNSFPLGELEETTGTPPYYMDEDYPAGPGITEPLPE